MSAPLISVIVPTLNVAPFIGECIESIDACGYPRLELIVVDNGSTDATLPEIRRLAKRLEFRFLEEPRRGAARARNLGLGQARGDWIQFLDADDLLLPGKLAHQASQTEDADLIVGSSMKRLAGGEESRISFLSGEPWVDLFAGRLGNTCANLWRTSALESVSGFDPDLASSQEYDLMFRLLRAGIRVRYDLEPLTLIRERSNASISSGDPKGRWERNVRLREQILHHIRTREPELYRRHHATIQYELQRRLYFLFTENRRMALDYHHRYMDPDFRIPAEAQVDGYYRGLMRLLGFRITCELRRAAMRAARRIRSRQGHPGF